MFYRENERRLDVLLVRLGYCSNLNEAKLCVRKGYVYVNNVQVQSHLLRINAFSTIGVYDTKLPFKLLQTEHLTAFPKMWRSPRVSYRLKRLSEVSLDRLDCNSKDRGGVKFMELLSYLRRKNK
jgi:ribosomal protein S4